MQPPVDSNGDSDCAPAPLVLSYEGPATPAVEEDRGASVAIVATCVIIAMLLFAIAAMLIIDVLVPHKSGKWTMIGCLVAPFCVLMAAKLLYRAVRAIIARRDCSDPPVTP